MTLRNLEIFVKTCETGNMTIAAQQLYISQSAVSHAISQLEELFDTTLFIRQSNRIYVTTAGERLLKHAKRMVTEQTQLKSAMAAERDHRSIRIGVVNTFGQHLILEMMADYLHEWPTTDFSIVSYPASVLPEMLNVSAIDVAFTFDPEETRYTSSLLVRRREKAFCCTTGSIAGLSDGDRIELSALPKGELPFFFEADSKHLIPQVSEKLRENGSEIRVRGVMQSPDEIKQAVSFALGMGMLSKSGCFVNPKTTFFEIAGLDFSVDLYLVHNRSRPYDSPVDDFIEFVRRSIAARRTPKLSAYSVFDISEVLRPKHAFYD